MNAKRQLENCLTVKDLIEQLQNCDPKLPVVFEYPSGDHWRRSLAGTVETVEVERIQWSDYHDIFKVPKTDAINRAEGDVVDVIILR